MSRNDCLWVAMRCTGLFFLIITVLSLPPLVTAWTMYGNGPGGTVTTDVSGFGQISQSIASAGRTAFIQALLQVLLAGLSSAYFLAGAPGLSRWMSTPED